MMALRGASVGKVNRRRVVQVIEALSVATLAILTIIFFVAGIHGTIRFRTSRATASPSTSK